MDIIIRLSAADRKDERLPFLIANGSTKSSPAQRKCAKIFGAADECGSTQINTCFERSLTSSHFLLNFEWELGITKETSHEHKTHSYCHF